MGVFSFRQFDVDDSGCGMKICTDSVLLGAWFGRAHTDARRVADVGAGSGVLTLICAQYMPQAHVTALEIDPQAAHACGLNFAASPWNDRLTVAEGDFMAWSPSAPVDAIISNPPYFTTGELSADKARAGARHQSGLTYATLIAKAARWLSDDGRLALVSPAEFGSHIVFEAEMAGLKLRRRLAIRTSPAREPSRTLWDFGRRDGDFTDGTLALRNADGTISDDYRQLTSELYIKL